MNNKYIKEALSSKVLMIGEYFKNNAPGGMAAVLASYDVYFDNMRFIPTWRSGSWLVKLSYAIYSYIMFLSYMFFDKNIRIIHLQGAAFASFERNIFFVKLGKFFRKKVIMHMHCADFESYFNPSRHKNRIVGTINDCDLFIVLSDSWKDYFTNIGVEERRIFVLNNTICPPQIKTIEKKSECLNLLYLGVIGTRKGIYDILEVLHNKYDKFKGRVFLRIGGNQEEEKLMSLIKAYNLEGMVCFEGFVSGDHKIECLNWADAYILPSFNEGLPIGILEAMSYGKAIISSPVGGIPAVVKSGENGILVEPGNLQEIENAITRFIEDRSLIDKYGKKSSEMVKPYLPKSVFRTLEELYTKLIS